MKKSTCLETTTHDEKNDEIGTILDTSMKLLRSYVNKKRLISIIVMLLFIIAYVCITYYSNNIFSNRLIKCTLMCTQSGILLTLLHVVYYRCRWLSYLCDNEDNVKRNKKTRFEFSNLLGAIIVMVIITCVRIGVYLNIYKVQTTAYDVKIEQNGYYDLKINVYTDGNYRINIRSKGDSDKVYSCFMVNEATNEVVGAPDNTARNGKTERLDYEAAKYIDFYDDFFIRGITKKGYAIKLSGHTYIDYLNKGTYYIRVYDYRYWKKDGEVNDNYQDTCINIECTIQKN